MNKLLFTIVAIILFISSCSEDRKNIRVTYYDNFEVRALSTRKCDTLTDKFIRFYKSGVFKDVNIKDTSGYEYYYTFSDDGKLNSYLKVNTIYNEDEVYNFNENLSLKNYRYLQNDSLLYIKKFDLNGKFVSQSGSIIKKVIISNKDSVIKLNVVTPPLSYISVSINDSVEDELDSVSFRNKQYCKKINFLDSIIEINIKTQDIGSGEILKEKLILKKKLSR